MTTKQEMINDILELNPVARIKKSSSFDEIHDQLVETQKWAAEHRRLGEAKERRNASGNAIGMSPTHGADQYDAYEEEHGANFLNAQGWIVANSLMALTTSAQRLAEIKGYLERYEMLKKWYESGTEMILLDTASNPTTTTVTEDDCAEALDELLRTIRHVELPRISNSSLNDLRDEFDRRKRQNERFLAKRAHEEEAKKGKSAP